MRVLLLSDVNSSHTIRWAKSLVGKGIEIAIFSFVPPKKDWYSELNIKVETLGLKKKKTGGSTFFSKVKYLFLLPKVKKFIKRFQPDIVHAHFLTNNGILADQINFHPFIISVWGSDVFFDLENHKVLQKKMKKALNNADLVCSTSKIMTQPILPYTNKIEVIPFGIDTTLFKPATKIAPENTNTIVIGTIKSLKPIYGIDQLIRVVARIIKSRVDLNIELHIYGNGPEKENYLNLANELNVTQQVKFFGFIPNSEVPKALNSFNIFANLSVFESFGVSVLEASACGIPVITTNVGGLPEVVINNKTGILVDPNDENQIFDAFNTLISDADLRNSMGVAGRNFVNEQYEINSTTDKMIQHYRSLL